MSSRMSRSLSSFKPCFLGQKHNDGQKRTFFLGWLRQMIFFNQKTWFFLPSTGSFLHVCAPASQSTCNSNMHYQLLHNSLSTLDLIPSSSCFVLMALTAFSSCIFMVYVNNNYSCFYEFNLFGEKVFLHAWLYWV